MKKWQNIKNEEKLKRKNKKERKMQKKTKENKDKKKTLMPRNVIKSIRHLFKTLQTK